METSFEAIRVTPAGRLLLQHSKSIGALPWLYDLHGIGFMFHGAALKHDDIGPDLFARTHWITLIYVPIIPLGIYLLSHPKNKRDLPRKNRVFVHRSIKLSGVIAAWGVKGLMWLIGSAWLIALGAFAVMVVFVIIGDLAGLWRVTD